MRDSERYYNLWNQQEEYSDDDFKFLKRYIKEKKFKVKYGFYNKESLMKKNIALIFDLIPFQPRRTGVENNWEIISSRDMTNKEIEEFIIHYFRNSFKRFLVFYYKNIEKLIFDDNKLKATTPDEFIQLCHKKGYSGSFQLKLEY